eukprot:gene5471-4019_t
MGRARKNTGKTGKGKGRPKGAKAQNGNVHAAAVYGMCTALTAVLNGLVPKKHLSANARGKLGPVSLKAVSCVLLKNKVLGTGQNWVVEAIHGMSMRSLRAAFALGRAAHTIRKGPRRR